jgi:hypothetical protein
MAVSVRLVDGQPDDYTIIHRRSIPMPGKKERKLIFSRGYKNT